MKKKIIKKCIFHQIYDFQARKKIFEKKQLFAIIKEKPHLKLIRKKSIKIGVGNKINKKIIYN